MAVPDTPVADTPTDSSVAVAPVSVPFDGKAFVASLPNRPGVYRMLDASGTILYVGKARNLKSRVASYFRSDLSDPKTQALVPQIVSMEITVTHSDIEALLLEFNLIKRHLPRYNVLLKDNRTFPYLYLSSKDAFPRLSFHRGTRKLPGRYFGPYPNSTAVRETLVQLQKLFQLRSCEDSYFANRTRPCLQYQIKRCSAPCVGLTTEAAYAQEVGAVVRVLEGRNDEVAHELAERMDQAALVLAYEKAAVLRDQLAALKEIQARQVVSGAASLECDVVAAVSGPGLCAIAVMLIRGGLNLGTTTYFARAPAASLLEVEEAFLAQHYLTHPAPREIVIGQPVTDPEVLSQALSDYAGHRVTIHVGARGLKASWVSLTRDNADQSLKMRLAVNVGVNEQLEELGEALGMASPPVRLECFDISHTGGEATVASCVVFGPEGPIKSDYRRFNLDGITPGDDYAAMRLALTRRYQRVKAGEAKCPDVLLIDGGAGQLAEAVAVLASLGVEVPRVVGVAKGADRRVGQERLFLPDEEQPLCLAPESRALHVIQRVRDEAHRFAVAGHRARRAKTRQSSVLEGIPGLGAARRRELLKQFGGLQGILGAGVADLVQVKGIGQGLAVAIYEHLHPGG